MNLLGVDVGGTFTDLVLTETDSGSVHIHKVPTSGEDPSEGVMKGVGEICEIAGVDPGQWRTSFTVPLPQLTPCSSTGGRRSV